MPPCSARPTPRPPQKGVALTEDLLPGGTGARPPARGQSAQILPTANLGRQTAFSSSHIRGKSVLRIPPAAHTCFPAAPRLCAMLSSKPATPTAKLRKGRGREPSARASDKGHDLGGVWRASCPPPIGSKMSSLPDHHGCWKLRHLVYFLGTGGLFLTCHCRGSP